MSYGIAFIVLACAAALLAAGLTFAHARAGARGLTLTGAGFAVIYAGFFLWRGAVHGTEWSRVESGAALVIVAVAAGAVVIYLRRRSGRHLLTGVLAWAATLFAYFQLAFMLRPR